MGTGGPPLPQRGIVAAQMHAVAQVADLVVALDKLLAQPLDLFHGVTNKLGIGITANADTTSPVGTFGALGPSCVVLEFSWGETGAVSRKVFFALGSGRSAPYRLGLNIHSDLLQLVLNL
jgi:hypothetical protein